MSYRVFRVEHRTCMVCGHDQRCRIRIIDGMEQAPICHSCLGEGPWMSMPKLTPPKLACVCGREFDEGAWFCGACGAPSPAFVTSAFLGAWRALPVVNWPPGPHQT